MNATCAVWNSFPRKKQVGIFKVVVKKTRMANEETEGKTPYSSYPPPRTTPFILSAEWFTLSFRGCFLGAGRLASLAPATDCSSRAGVPLVLLVPLVMLA